eukprot:6076451-Prymnesium_polylepis.1
MLRGGCAAAAGARRHIQRAKADRDLGLLVAADIFREQLVRLEPSPGEKKSRVTLEHSVCDGKAVPAAIATLSECIVKHFPRDNQLLTHTALRQNRRREREGLVRCALTARDGIVAGCGARLCGKLGSKVVEVDHKRQHRLHPAVDRGLAEEARRLG